VSTPRKAAWNSPPAMLCDGQPFQGRSTPEQSACPDPAEPNPFGGAFCEPGIFPDIEKPDAGRNARKTAKKQPYASP
jgi:hypothetical protein